MLLSINSYFPTVIVTRRQIFRKSNRCNYRFLGLRGNLRTFVHKSQNVLSRTSSISTLRVALLSILRRLGRAILGFRFGYSTKAPQKDTVAANRILGPRFFVIPIISVLSVAVKRVASPSYNKHYVNLNRSKYHYFGTFGGCETIHKRQFSNSNGIDSRGQS